MILDMFKPAWQSTNPLRRRKGVLKLDPDVTGEADTLYSLASQDPEQSVRLAAIERISNITLLVRLLKNAPTSLEQDKLGRLVTLAALEEASDLEGLQKAVGLIDMDEDLLKIALTANSSDAQAQAVHKIQAEEPLLEVASHHPLSKLRVVAAEKIDNPTLLNQLLEKAKGKDKSVWRIAKEKLDSVKAQEQEVEQQREAANDCYNQIQTMQNHDIDVLFKQKWRLLKSRWDAIPSGEKDHLDPSPILDAVNTRIEAFEARSAEEAYQLENKADAEEEQVQTLQLLAEALSILKSTETDDIDIPSLRATLTTQVSRWEEAAELNPPLDHQQTAFERDSQKLSQAIDAIYTLRKHLQAIKATHEELHQLDADDLARNGELFNKTKQLISRISWPKDVIIPKDMQRLTTDFQCLEERQKRQKDVLSQHQQAIEQNIEKLKGILESGQLSDTDRRIKSIQQLLKKIPDHSAEPFRNELKPLLAQYAELKDWQAFAAQPKKEALIQSMEGLTADTTADVDPGVRLDYIQKLQSEWKQLGRLSQNVEQALWDKFQTASKAAYAPCKAFYEDQANTRERNKAHREKMCAQLTDYLEQYNWAKADWNSVQDTIKLAREEWKRYLPIDRKYHKALEDQFQTLMQQLNDRLNAHKQSNQRIKQRLLDQAIALLEKDDLDAAIESMKSIRTEWRTIGMLPPETYKAINQAFFDTYSSLMNRKQKQWSDVEAQKKHNAQQIKDALDTLDTLLTASDPAKLVSHQQELAHAEQAFVEFMPLLDQDNRKLRKRFDLLATDFKNASQIAKTQIQQQTIETLWHRSQLLRSLENKVLQGALTNDALQTLTDEWNQIPDTNHQSMATLNARFDAAIHARTSENTQALEEISKKADLYARELCVLMDILSETDSPEEDAELRMQLQVNRLNHSLQQRGDENKHWNELDNLCLEWCNTGPLSIDARQTLEPRFTAGRERYLVNSDS